MQKTMHASFAAKNCIRLASKVSGLYVQAALAQFQKHVKRV